jgi:exodeoxyribonuclease VII large subunit
VTLSLALEGGTSETGGNALASYLVDIAATFRRSSPRPTWVRCEVARVNRRLGGQVYLQLTEASEADGPARVEAIVWPDRAQDVLGRFAKETGSELTEGMRILMLVAPRFSPRWGFCLTTLDIDPAWTVGESLLVAAAVRTRLAAEGVWGRNRELTGAADYTSVAVIAPDCSAGLEDFMVEARKVAANDLCRVEVSVAQFEGARASAAVSEAIPEVSEARRGHQAVFVLRGGGSAAALAWLNAEEIARAACVCRLPVITGIGHETDRVLLDEVSNASFGTPSKTAQHLVGTIIERALQTREAWDDLAALARQSIAAERASVDAVMREAVGLGPAATIARGYAVVSARGIPVTSAAEAMKHLSLEARFLDGSVRLRPEEAAT